MTRDLPADRPSFGNAICPMDHRGGDINVAAFRTLIRYMADGGTTVCVGGPHATEFVHLNAAERLRVWELAVDELGGRAPLSAIPVGPTSNRDMVATFRTVEAMGFDAAQLYPNAHGGYGGDGLFVAEVERYYRDVLDATTLPLFITNYHRGEIIDSPTKRVPHALLLRLLDAYPGRIGGFGVIWRGAEDLQQLLDGVGGRVHVRVSGALDWHAAMEAGAHGFHSIQQSFVPRLCSGMMAAFHAGDHATSRRLSERIAALNAIIHHPDRAYPRSIKPTLRYLGFDVGDLRPPHYSMGAAADAALWDDLATIDFAETEQLPEGGPVALRPAD